MDNVRAPESAPARARPGRKLGFDRRRALETALELFWTRGYEGTSVADLVAAMGIAPPSLYTAFGSKEALYREAVALYLAEPGAFMARALAEESTARAAMARLLTEAAEAYPTAPGEAGGGLLVSTGALGCAPENASVAQEMTVLRTRSRAALRERFERAVKAGELPPGTDTAALAAFYAATIQGMSVQARDGADAATLRAIAEAALRAWPASSAPEPMLNGDPEPRRRPPRRR